MGVILLVVSSRLKKLRHYHMAFGGVILAIAIMDHPAYWISFIFGVWALVLLLDVQCREAFRQNDLAGDRKCDGAIAPQPNAVWTFVRGMFAFAFWILFVSAVGSVVVYFLLAPRQVRRISVDPPKESNTIVIKKQGDECEEILFDANGISINTNQTEAVPPVTQFRPTDSAEGENKR
jgi:hypothetical protein